MEQTKRNDNDQRPQNDAEKNTSPQQGRVAANNPQTDAEDAADISEIDQQEGRMNHGELGGNFNTAGSAKGA